MTTTETSPLKTAREICIFTMNSLRAYQAAQGVPESERCELPKTFKLFRNIKRIEALTAEYTAKIDKICSDFGARKVVETPAIEVIAEPEPVAVKIAKPVVLSAGEQMMAKLQEKAATEAARKTCRLAQAEAYRFQKLADVPMEKRCKLPTGFDSFDRAQYEALTAEYVATADELRNAIEKKIADDAEAKADAEAARVLARQETFIEREKLEYRYRDLLGALARRCHVQPSELPLYHPVASRVSNENLRALVDTVLKEGARIDAVEAQEELDAKRKSHEQQQKLLKSYNDARRSGREGRTFNAWMASQGRGAMRRTG